MVATHLAFHFIHASCGIGRKFRLSPTLFVQLFLDTEERGPLGQHVGWP